MKKPTLRPTSDIKVMIVDDSSSVRNVTRLFLTSAGFQILTCEDGYEALARVSQYAPDIIFVDVKMPRIDGYYFCALIKANDALSGIPIVMVSGSAGVFDIAKGRLCGISDYLTKPLSKEKFFESIERFVEGCKISAEDVDAAKG